MIVEVKYYVFSRRGVYFIDSMLCGTIPDYFLSRVYKK